MKFFTDFVIPFSILIVVILLLFIFAQSLDLAKSDISVLQTKIAELEKRVSVREIPKLHCTSATIFINGGEITVKTDQME